MIIFYRGSLVSFATTDPRPGVQAFVQAFSAAMFQSYPERFK